MGKAAGICTHEQYEKIVDTVKSGFVLKSAKRHYPHVPNPTVAAAIVVEANAGIRIGDVLSLRRSSFVKTKDGHRFDIVEQKTGKKRTFVVQEQLYDFLMDYADKYVNGDDLFFPITVRTFQRHIRNVCEYLGDDYRDISSHSFRKMFASNVYYKSNCDIELTRRLLQHSSAAVTAHYIGVTDKVIEQTLNGIVDIV